MLPVGLRRALQDLNTPMTISIAAFATKAAGQLPKAAYECTSTAQTLRMASQSGSVIFSLMPMQPGTCP
jgi:hypothetical protein